jgi:hypothetical protein
MADTTIKERIMQNIAGALGSITKANGYSVDIASVQRYRYSGLNLATVPLLHLRAGDDEVMRDKMTAPYVARRFEVYVSFVDRPDPNADARSSDEMLNAVGADIEKCLMADPTRGGLAIWTGNPDWMEAVVNEDEPHLAQAYRFPIDYRHHFKDPAVNT